MRIKEHSQYGFSLIELVVVVAFVGILAAIAFPNFIEQVRKSRRADIVTDIIECAGILERRFTIKSTYTAADCNSIANDKFDIVVTVGCLANGNNNCFDISATPAGGYKDPSCASLTFDEVGQKGALNDGGSDHTDVCWRS